MRKTKEVLRLRFELGLGQRCRSIEKGKKQIHLGAILEQ
jgi:hypothetical protein